MADEGTAEEKKKWAQLAILRILEKTRIQQAALATSGVSALIGRDKPQAKPNVGALKNILRRTLNDNDARQRRRKRNRAPTKPSELAPTSVSASTRFLDKPPPSSAASRRKRSRWDQPRLALSDESLPPDPALAPPPSKRIRLKGDAGGTTLLSGSEITATRKPKQVDEIRPRKRSGSKSAEREEDGREYENQ